VIPVDVFGNPKARLTNALALKESIQWVDKAERW